LRNISAREDGAANGNAGPWASATPSVPRPRTGPAIGADASINADRIFQVAIGLYPSAQKLN